MIAKAISRYTRVSPRKANLLTRLLKGMTVAEAYAFLGNVNKRASRLIYNVLKSAFDNARKKEPDVKETDLFISKIVADSGPMSKRFRAASMGRATMIRKRTSHLIVNLDMKELPKKELSKTEKKREGIVSAVKKRAIFKKKIELEKKKSIDSAGSTKKLATHTKNN